MEVGEVDISKGKSQSPNKQMNTYMSKRLSRIREPSYFRGDHQTPFWSGGECKVTSRAQMCQVTPHLEYSLIPFHLWSFGCV